MIEKSCRRAMLLIAGLISTINLNSQVIFEAEDAFVSSGFTDVKHTGYTGDGFVDTENAVGVYIEWTFNSLFDLTDSVGFRYALGKDEHRTMQVVVNDILTDTIDFDNTNLFTNWVYKYTIADLNLGINKIRLVSINAEGAPNIDHMSAKIDTNIYFKVTYQINGNGSVSTVPDADSFLYGSRIRITAEPEAGNIFNEWTGDVSGTTNPLKLVIDTNYSIAAGFLNVLRAFPGAEGFAKNITGGRGGAVYEVTNLNDAGAGSLRDAVNQTGKRTIVFRVAGTIELNSKLSITKGDLTIAGQTAPGDGITVSGYPITISAPNVIIRYIRARLGDIKLIEDDAMNGRNTQNVLLDHCTMSWSVDECASFYDNTNFTMQYCLMSESLYNSVHDKGQHGYGGIWGGKGATFHHNLLAHHTSRNPRFCGSRYSNLPDQELVDFRNNVIFNWGGNSVYGAEGGTYNIVNNYYKFGPATSANVKSRIIAPNADDGSNAQPAGVWGRFYVDGNFVNGYANVTDNNWTGVHVNAAFVPTIKSDIEFDVAEVTTHEAQIAFEHVIAAVGACIPNRDPVDNRIISEVISGKPTYGASFGAGKGIIDTQADVGGWPALQSETPPTDSDHDGMPDAWETARALNPSDPADRNLDDNHDGYTNLEEYLNELVAAYTYIIRPLNFRFASTENNVVVLSWDDIVEHETAFLLERKLDNGKYEQLAVIAANTTTYTDELFDSGIYSYRLRAANFSDTSFYTDTLSFEVIKIPIGIEQSAENLFLELAPNPFNTELTISLTLSAMQQVSFKVYSVTGTLITESSLGSVPAGSTTVNIDTVNFPKGIYVLVLQTDNTRFVRKITKM